jgi:DNA-binding transcriptional ArsR family regulator
MTLSKGLIIGLVAALAVGVAASAVQNSAQERLDDSPMTIPVSRVGDRVVYARFTGTTQAGDHDLVGLEELRIGKPSTALDATGAVHDAVPVSTNRTFESASSGWSLATREHLDLTTRLAVRTDIELSDGARGGSTRYLRSEFGPQTSITDPIVFSLQGLTLRLGDDLGHASGPVGRGVDIPFAFLLLDSNVSTSSLRVVDRALVDGQDAYVLEQSIDGTFRVSSPMIFGAASSGIDTKAKGVMKAQRTIWISSQVPYPLLIEETRVLEIEGLPSILDARVLSLELYTPGTTPVTWGQERAVAHWRSINPEAERQPGWYPVDGSSAPLAYPLAEAMSSVASDAKLTGYTAWRQTHPGSRLAGASYAVVGNQAQGETWAWRLRFATPDGQAYDVSSERSQASRVTINRDLGATRVTPFAIADLATQPITISAASRAWGAVAGPDMRTATPNVYSWGLIEAGAGIGELRTLTIGLMQTAGGEAQMSKLRMRVDDGVMLGLDETQVSKGAGSGLNLLKEPYSNPETRPKTVPAGVQPPSITSSAQASAPLVAGVLIVYFWPLLKFVGAQGLILAAGFARLDRSGLLKNKVREELMTLIRAEPGIHASDMARRVDAGWGTIVYHLHVMERNKLISSLVDGRHKRFFPVGEVDWSKRGQLAALRNPMTRSLYELIQEDPGVIQGSLAKAVGISVPSVIWHLKRLEDAGLVGRDKQGRKVHYYPNRVEDIPAPYDPDDAVEVV